MVLDADVIRSFVARDVDSFIDPFIAKATVIT